MHPLKDPRITGYVDEAPFVPNREELESTKQQMEKGRKVLEEVGRQMQKEASLAFNYPSDAFQHEETVTGRAFRVRDNREKKARQAAKRAKAEAIENGEEWISLPKRNKNKTRAQKQSRKKNRK